MIGVWNGDTHIGSRDGLSAFIDLIKHPEMLAE